MNEYKSANNKRIKLSREQIVNIYPPFRLMGNLDNKKIFVPTKRHLYIHLPFCPKKCNYCYYKTYEDVSTEEIEKYISYLKKEIFLYSKLPLVQSSIFKTIYFGGGSSTMLTNEQLEDLSTFIFKTLNIDKDVEFCTELRPSLSYLTIDKLEKIKNIGVTRISFGFQNFNKEILELNGRDNTIDEYKEIFKRARNLGFRTINVDMMSGMLGETKQTWYSNIDKLMEFDADSVAFYKLEIYPNTNLFFTTRKNKRTKSAHFMTDEEEQECIEYAYNSLLKEEKYKISSYLHLVKGDEHRHVQNDGILKCEEIIGCGVSAHSFFNNAIYQNSYELKDYFSILDNESLPIERSYILSIKDLIHTYFVYGIKNMIIDLKEFNKRFGIDGYKYFKKAIDFLVSQNILFFSSDKILVNNKYAMYADDICRYFFQEEHKNINLTFIPRKKLANNLY